MSWFKTIFKDRVPTDDLAHSLFDTMVFEASIGEWYAEMMKQNPLIEREIYLYRIATIFLTLNIHIHNVRNTERDAWEDVLKKIISLIKLTEVGDAAFTLDEVTLAMNDLMDLIDAANGPGSSTTFPSYSFKWARNWVERNGIKDNNFVLISMVSNDWLQYYIMIFNMFKTIKPVIRRFQ